MTRSEILALAAWHEERARELDAAARRRASVSSGRRLSIQQYDPWLEDDVGRRQHEQTARVLREFVNASA